MFLTKTVNSVTNMIKAIVILGLIVCLMVFSKQCSKGAKDGIEMCLSVLIPSLFPFMALSSFIVNSKIANNSGRISGFIMKTLFGLDASFAPVIFLSMIGGYPVGAKAISTLSNSIEDKSQAQSAIYFAVCAGPGFLVNFVGVSIYQSREIGIILLLSQIISVILIGIVLNLVDKFSKNKSNNKNNINTYKAKYSNRKMDIPSAIVVAASDASKGIITICAFVILFSAFCELLDTVMPEGIFENILIVLCEVCSAVTTLSKNSPLEAVAFAIGFGGLCVHFQIFACLSELKIDKFKFFLIRIIQGALTAFLAHIMLVLKKIPIQTFSSGENHAFCFSNSSLIGGAVLIFVCICFLLSLKHLSKNNFRR